MSRFIQRLAVISLSAALLLYSVRAEEKNSVIPKSPVIAPRTFPVSDFGASVDGKSLSTSAFQGAIDACAKAGGGQVIVPAGIYVCGPIELRSGIDLHLAKGAILKMSQNPQDYPVSGRERRGFITATDACDVQFSGEGEIDGQGESWWTAFRAIKGTADEANAPRRPQMIALTRCERVKLAGFKTLNPPNTHCSLRQCKEVIIDGLTMTAPDESPNTDALNLNIRNAVIRNCHIATGDDNIVFLASAPAKDGAAAVENVLVTDCTLGVGHGLSIGSYTSGGIRNISVENMTFAGTTAGIRLKAARDRGGLVENLTFKNFTMTDVKNPIYFTSYYPKTPKHPDDKEQPADAKTPRWRNITVESGTITNGAASIVLWGLPEQPIEGITLRNLKIAAEKGATVYHAKGVKFENVEIKPIKGAPLATFHAEVEGMDAMPLAQKP